MGMRVIYTPAKNDLNNSIGTPLNRPSLSLLENFSDFYDFWKIRYFCEISTDWPGLARFYALFHIETI